MKRLMSSPLLVVACALAVSASLAGCDLLKVDNPNNLLEEDLNDPASVEALANGAEASLTRAMIDIIGPYSVAGDEIEWIGSRDAWQRIDAGNIDAPLNEYNNRIYMYVAEARWVADEYIRKLEAFKAEGQLPSNRPLIRTYLYGAIAYVTIADMYDNFVFSDRRDPGKPIGEENMIQLYDGAIEYVGKALALSPAVDLKKALLGMRARAIYSKGLWKKVNSVDNVNTSDPLVNGPQAAAAAAKALDLMDEGYEYQLITNPSLGELIPFDQALAEHVNVRHELRIGDRYILPTDDGQGIERVVLLDPIDEVVAPFLEQTIKEFTAAEQYADFTVVSARGMHLIIAETALAQGNTAEFAAHINVLRERYGLTPWSGQIPALDMLIHARRVYLFLQGRRLTDQYRFQILSPSWVPQSDAAQHPGTFFPIPAVERRNNPNV